MPDLILAIETYTPEPAHMGEPVDVTLLLGNCLCEINVFGPFISHVTDASHIHCFMFLVTFLALLRIFSLKGTDVMLNLGLNS